MSSITPNNPRLAQPFWNPLIAVGFGACLAVGFLIGGGIDLVRYSPQKGFENTVVAMSPGVEKLLRRLGPLMLGSSLAAGFLHGRGVIAWLFHLAALGGSCHFAMAYERRWRVLLGPNLSFHSFQEDGIATPEVIYLFAVGLVLFGALLGFLTRPRKAKASLRIGDPSESPSEVDSSFRAQR
jgi:hypothetical protein